MLYNNSNIKYNCRLRRGSRDNTIFTTIILVVCGMCLHVRQVHSFATVTAPCLPLKSSIGKIFLLLLHHLSLITRIIILLYHKMRSIMSSQLPFSFFCIFIVNKNHVISSHAISSSSSSIWIQYDPMMIHK
jgi:hypothetical protein